MQRLKQYKPSESPEHQLFDGSKEGEAGEKATELGPYPIYFKRLCWQARSQKPDERNGEGNLGGKIKESNGKVAGQGNNA